MDGTVGFKVLTQVRHGKTELKEDSFRVLARVVDIDFGTEHLIVTRFLGFDHYSVIVYENIFVLSKCALKYCGSS